MTIFSMHNNNTTYYCNTNLPIYIGYNIVAEHSSLPEKQLQNYFVNDGILQSIKQLNLDICNEYLYFYTTIK